MNALKITSRILVSALIAGAASFGVSSVNPGQASAACSALPTDKGTVTNTVSIPTTTSYRVWTRIKTADSAKNSVYMQIDDSICNVVVGGASLTANTWTWVDYTGGSSSTKFNASLTAGSHTVIMAGKDDGVMVDRVIFTQDTACVPTGTGDNCANPPDTTNPIVSVTSPANNAVISSSTQATATATDDVAVTKVEFYIDGVLKATDTTSAYNYTIDPATLTVGAHKISAKAFDAAGNTTTSSDVNFTVADTVKPTVSISTPANGSTQSGTIAVTATAADNVGVSKVEFYADGVLKSTISSSPFTTSLDTTALTNGSRALTAKAFDAAGNNTTSAAVNITVNNVATPPADNTDPTVSITAPASGATISGNYNFTATAADASGVKQVQFYIDNVLRSTDTSAPFSYTIDTTTLSNASHSFKVVATDNSSNQNTAETTLNATVSNGTYRAEDINRDRKINFDDFIILAQDYNKTGGAIQNARSDINASNKVDFDDFILLAQRYNTTY